MTHSFSAHWRIRSARRSPCLSFWSRQAIESRTLARWYTLIIPAFAGFLFSHRKKTQITLDKLQTWHNIWKHTTTDGWIQIHLASPPKAPACSPRCQPPAKRAGRQGQALIKEERVMGIKAKYTFSLWKREPEGFWSHGELELIRPGAEILHFSSKPLWSREPNDNLNNIAIEQCNNRTIFNSLYSILYTRY